MAVAMPESAVGADTGRALTELYKAHSAEAFRFALHLTGRRADAEDVVQHAFLQAYRHLASGRELVSPRAWLLTAVKHRAYNLARDRRELPVDQMDVTAQPRDASRDEAAELAEVRGMLWTLPEAQHQAFVLRHWSGLSQSEIAEVLETTPSAVESLLVRARSALVRSHESASETCRRVRGRLLDSSTLRSSDQAHIGSCWECRRAHTRLARAANLAGSLALVPGAHVADSLARLIPGFSAHAATTTAAAAGTTGAGASAGAGAGVSGTTATWGTAAVSTAGKTAVAAKSALAALAATAVIGAAPSAGHAVSGLVAHHSGSSATHATRHRVNRAAPPVVTPTEPPGQATGGLVPGGAGGDAPLTNPGKDAGARKGPGKPVDVGAGKPADPVGNKPADPGGNGAGGGKPADPGGNGAGGGKPADPGGNGAGGGKPADPGTNGNADTKGNAGGNGSAGGGTP
jgi:RNA polymerase sigma factor (sigma-70 family)